MDFKFTEEEFNEFNRALDIQKLGMDWQKEWEQNWPLFLHVFKFLDAQAQAHPMVGMSAYVTALNGDVTEAKKNFAQVKRVVDAYFELIFSALNAIDELKERNKRNGE
ncbi:MAG: hypothetical protein HZB62_10590 [Nitrospirae bacterium]|nr:hypothetical protein [Nitrospirota bacterium]